MKSISLKTKIVTGLLAGGMILSSVSLALATTATKPLSNNESTPSKHEFRQPKNKLEATLKLGVSSKIITQVDSDKILVYKNSRIKIKDKKGKDKAEKPDLYKELVTNKILTQAKADALKTIEQTQRAIARKLELDTNLAKLLSENTITQDQSNKIKAVMIKEEAVKKANFEKTKTMTKEQRKTYIKRNKKNHINPIKSLVANGTITQTQAEKLGHLGHGDGNHMPGSEVK